MSSGAMVSVKATVENPRGSVEKLSPKESPEDSHTVLRGAAWKDSVSIQGQLYRDWTGNYAEWKNRTLRRVPRMLTLS